MSLSWPGKSDSSWSEATSPLGGVIINQKTKFVLKKPDFLPGAGLPRPLRGYRRSGERT